MMLSKTAMIAALTLLSNDARTGEAQAVFDALAGEFPALNATVMVQGEIVWEAEGGTRRDASDGVERDYNVYSVAKMLTGLAFARLEQEEGMDLDQSVRAIDPSLPEAYQAVTPRLLLSHLGGVRHYQGERDWRDFNDMRCAAPADALAHFIADPLASEPGTQFQYTTFGFALLSHLLVEATGAESYDAAMAQALGEGVYRARTDRDGAEKAMNYHANWRGALNEIELSAECKFGGGGLLASSRDLAAMGADFAAGAIVEVETIPTLLTSGVDAAGERVATSYGMGAGYSQEAGLHYAVHSGGSPGGRAYVAVFVEPQVVVALTANFDGPNHGDTALELARIFAGLPPSDED